MIGDAGGMQISASNLLLAGQQSQPARPQGTPFAAAMHQARPARFSPPDFDSETQDVAPPPAAAPKAGYAAIAAPGSQLDIRI
jgi:hypothetical protein